MTAALTVVNGFKENEVHASSEKTPRSAPNLCEERWIDESIKSSELLVVGANFP